MEYNFGVFSGEFRFNFAAEDNRACIWITRGKRLYSTQQPSLHVL